MFNNSSLTDESTNMDTSESRYVFEKPFQIQAVNVFAHRAGVCKMISTAVLFYISNLFYVNIVIVYVGSLNQRIRSTLLCNILPCKDILNKINWNLFFFFIFYISSPLVSFILKFITVFSTEQQQSRHNTDEH